MQRLRYLVEDEYEVVVHVELLQTDVDSQLIQGLVVEEPGALAERSVILRFEMEQFVENVHDWGEVALIQEGEGDELYQ